MTTSASELGLRKPLYPETCFKLEGRPLVRSGTFDRVATEVGDFERVDPRGSWTRPALIELAKSVGAISFLVSDNVDKLNQLIDAEAPMIVRLMGPRGSLRHTSDFGARLVEFYSDDKGKVGLVLEDKYGTSGTLPVNCRPFTPLALYVSGRESVSS
jgi:hypothetical protein